jgi:hypothetical protein
MLLILYITRAIIARIIVPLIQAVVGDKQVIQEKIIIIT